jgi:hypothetical protein
MILARLVFAQSHVLREPGIAADVERHEVGELRRLTGEIFDLR